MQTVKASQATLVRQSGGGTEHRVSRKVQKSDMWLMNRQHVCLREEVRVHRIRMGVCVCDCGLTRRPRSSHNCEV